MWDKSLLFLENFLFSIEYEHQLFVSAEKDVLFSTFASSCKKDNWQFGWTDHSNYKL